MLWKDDLNSVMGKSMEEINFELEKLDWLTFPWQRLPHKIFVKIFHVCGRKRLTFFVTYFRLYFGPLNVLVTSEFMNMLWKHFTSFEANEIPLPLP